MIPSSSWTTPTSDSHEEMTAVLKKELRRRITSATQTLSDAEVTAQSFLLAEKVCALPEFVRARGVSVYLEMPKEAATSKLLEAAFASDKKVFVPKIFGRSADDLMMLQTMAMEDVRSFPKDKWHIPDPPLLMDCGIPRDDALQGNELELELVLLPGVAFDRRGGRLGHGKGYYDSFLRRLTAHYDAIGCPPPVTVGLCLTPQLVEQVPLASHDCVLDLVVTPEEVIRVRTDLLSRLG
uniref:5-formyltetrahydrofolate cyclo-ligase n=1 Tax=Hyaloperonospora arabidopsidis (strain Emoy2) TaxID=559515 RepID=M4BRS0_HYAAE